MDLSDLVRNCSLRSVISTWLHRKLWGGHILGIGGIIWGWGRVVWNFYSYQADSFREAGNSRHHQSPIQGSLETPWIAWQYGTEGFQGSPKLGPDYAEKSEHFGRSMKNFQFRERRRRVRKRGSLGREVNSAGRMSLINLAQMGTFLCVVDTNFPWQENWCSSASHACNCKWK